MEESGFRAMTSILRQRPPKWDKVLERLFGELKRLTKDADLVGLMNE
jgi:hypothetical protein